MTGGLKVISQANADAYTEELHRQEDPVKVGEVLCEDPCVTDDMIEIIREKEGRDCPRADLMPANRIAADLIFPLLATKHEAGSGGMEGIPTGILNSTVWPVWFEVKTRNLDPFEKEELLNRIMWTINDSDIKQLTTVQVEKS